MQELSIFKNKYAGDKCLVIGNGPSLTAKLLKDILRLGLYSFVANGFCLIFDEINFQPDAVCMSNFDAIERYGEGYPEKTYKFFKAGWSILFKYALDNVFDLPFSCEHDKGKHKNAFIKDGNFTLDPAKMNYCGDTVLLDFAIPIAFYMGFEEIFLMGVDCDYSKGYFSEKYPISVKKGFKGMATNDFSIAIPSFRYAHDFLNRHGRKMFKLAENKRLNFIETRFPKLK